MADLQGEFIVDILSFLPSLKRLSHRKVMLSKGKEGIGHNVLYGRRWGHFLLTENTFKELGSLKAIQLSYDVEDNFYLMKHIRDYIRCIDKKTLYIGKFYYHLFGYPVLIGYFSLEKIQ